MFSRPYEIAGQRNLNISSLDVSNVPADDLAILGCLYAQWGKESDSVYMGTVLNGLTIVALEKYHEM